MKRSAQILSNWSYILWFFFYFYMTVLLLSFFMVGTTALLIAVIAYAISLLIAFSPIGEAILRAKIKAKEIITNQDKEYLVPIFDTVYEEALKYCPFLSQNIKLYLIDDLDINAYAIGRTTIAVTKGAMQALQPEGLASLLAHEFGHMAYGDTKAGLLNSIGNGFFSIYFRILNGIAGAFFGMAEVAKLRKSYITFIILKLIGYIVKGFVVLFIIIGNLLLSINSKQAEFKADLFAFNIGYGDFLKDTLYFLNDTFPEPKADITSLFYKSHPEMKKRIAKLEQALSEMG